MAGFLTRIPGTTARLKVQDIAPRMRSTSTHGVAPSLSLKALSCRFLPKLVRISFQQHLLSLHRTALKIFGSSFSCQLDFVALLSYRLTSFNYHHSQGRPNHGTTTKPYFLATINCSSPMARVSWPLKARPVAIYQPGRGHDAGQSLALRPSSFSQAPPSRSYLSILFTSQDIIICFLFVYSSHSRFTHLLSSH